MGALDYLKGYFKDNPTPAAILSGAIACFAAVAVIGEFGIDLQSTVPSVIYVVVIGIVFYLLVRLLDQPVARGAAGVFVAALVVGWIGAFFWSRLHPRNAELACAVYFWKPCILTADAVALENAVKPSLVVPPPGDLNSRVKAQHSVYIQFAGYTRPTIIALAKALSGQSWDVQGGDRGGERISTAARLAEVRYSDPDAKPAAEALAAAIKATGITNRTLKVVQIDGGNSNLEVWIGQ